MGFWRNPEIRHQLYLYTALILIFSGFGFVLGTLYGIAFLSVSSLYTLLAFATTYKRYKRIAALSHEIDAILHGKEIINLSEYAEGELSILQSDVSKLTVQLREQADALRSDKAYLADSIADISHQIRTPLTSINLIVSFLSEPDLPAERRMQLTQELTRFLVRIDWLISALLKMSKLDAGTANFQRDTVLVSELIKKAVEPIAIPMDLRDQKIAVIQKGAETFIGDLSWSVEAIGNVFKNCMEHTPVGGRLEVAVNENSLFTEIAIHDSGRGIDKEDLPHLFERFYKGKNASDQSVGIGLALSRMIITEQNGTIKAENAKYGGALFTVRFYKGTI